MIQDPLRRSLDPEAFTLSAKVAAMLEWGWFGGIIGLEISIREMIKRGWPAVGWIFVPVVALAMVVLFAGLGWLSKIMQAEPTSVQRTRDPLFAFGRALIFGLLIVGFRLAFDGFANALPTSIAGGIAAFLMALVAIPYGRPLRRSVGGPS